MIKKKIVSVAAAALAACSITATAFAAGVYTLPKKTLVEGQTVETIQPRIKDDNLYAVAYVDHGLDSGDTFLKFSVIDHKSGNDATGVSELWVNGRCTMNYNPGYGIVGNKYRLKVNMPPQANAHTITFDGSWTP